MSFGLSGATNKNLCEADPAMSSGSRERSVRKGIGTTPGLVQDAAQSLVGQWIVWPSRKHPADSALLRPISARYMRQKGCAHVGVDSPDAKQCVEVVWIKGQGALKKTARLRHVFQGNSLVE